MLPTSSTRPASSPRTGATALAKEVLGLVDWAVENRLRSLKHGWNRLDPHTVRAACDRLITWRSNNPCPSPATLRLWWQQHETTLRYVMPPNGAKRLQRIQTIIASL